MFKLLSSILFLATFLSFSCADSPSSENTKQVANETPIQQKQNNPSAVTVSTVVEVVEKTIVGEPRAKLLSSPVFKEKKRHEKTSSRAKLASAPPPKSVSKTTDVPQQPLPITNKSGNTSTTEKNIGTKPAIPPFSHDRLDALLRKHVSNSGKVDYKTFKKDKPVLEDYINLLVLNPPKSDWSKNKQMAYWINLYNAFTINAILEKYPVKSITDLEDGKVWDRKTINIAGEYLTLNNIEKKKLLKRFKDPRVHFAVNCAAASCPPLLNKAWTEDNIQRYLSQQTKAFINNSKENHLSAEAIQVSQIFNWYADDFGGKDKIASYFQKYAKTTIKDNAKVTFKEYDWSLND